MCRSTTECPGGRRCPEDTQKRRARQRAAYAAKVEAQRSLTNTDTTYATPQHLSPAPDPLLTPPATRQDVADAISDAKSALAQDHPLVEADKDGWDQTTPHGEDVEARIRRAGELLASRADTLAEDDLATIRESWAARGVTDNNSYLSYLDSQIDHDSTTAASLRRLRKERSRAAAGNGQWDMDHHQARAQACLRALQEQRPMGPPPAGITTHPDSDSRALSRIDAAACYYPQDWVERSNTRDVPLLVSHTNGRAVYRANSPITSWRTEMVAQERLVTDVPDDAEVIGRPVPALQVGDTLVAAEGEHDDAVLAYRVKVPVESARMRLQVADQIEVARDRVGWVAGGVSGGIHELGHHMESLHDDRLTSLGQAFLARRTTAGGSRQPLTGYHQCGDDRAPSSPAALGAAGEEGGAEWVRPDGFVDPYVGREYSHRQHTEVFSTGMEGTFAGRFGGLVGRGGYRPDVEHRHFTLGVLATL